LACRKRGVRGCSRESPSPAAEAGSWLLVSGLSSFPVAPYRQTSNQQRIIFSLFVFSPPTPYTRHPSPCFSPFFTWIPTLDGGMMRNPLVSCPKDNMNKFPRGAGGWTDARRQNPTGKNPLPSHSWVSAKEPSQGGYDFVSIQKNGIFGALRS
jgi:hypothetical protein